MYKAYVRTSEMKQTTLRQNQTPKIVGLGVMPKNQ